MVFAPLSFQQAATLILALGQPPAELAAQIDAILNAPALANARVGVCVKRVGDSTEMYAHEADTLLIPASNMKIVTSSAALYYLGPDYRFATQIYGLLHPNGVLEGDLVVQGNGDPSMVPERLYYLANRIYFAGVREVSGSIVIDDSYFTGPRLANGAEQDHSSNAYMAPTGAVSIGFNTVQVHVMPSLTNGGAARVLLDPPSEYATVEGEVATSSRGRTYVNVDVVPNPEGNRSIVRVTGRIRMDDPGRSFWRRIDNPPLYAGDVLKAMLQQLGVKVRGKVKLGRVADGAKRLLVLSSPRLAEIVNTLNKTSNNFVAEQLALALGAARFGAPGTWDKAQSAIEEFLENEVGIKRGSYQVKNGSGLHDVNRMTPREIVAVLEYMQQKPHLAPEFVSSLAVAGGSGTLSERMRKTDAAHLLRAKTGTLSNASALSGYVTTKSGETVAFSILVNDYHSGISDIWTVQDQIGALLAGMRLPSNNTAAMMNAASTNTEVAVP